MDEVMDAGGLNVISSHHIYRIYHIYRISRIYRI